MRVSSAIATALAHIKENESLGWWVVGNLGYIWAEEIAFLSDIKACRFQAVTMAWETSPSDRSLLSKSNVPDSRPYRESGSFSPKGEKPENCKYSEDRASQKSCWCAEGSP